MINVEYNSSLRQILQPFGKLGADIINDLQTLAYTIHQKKQAEITGKGSSFQEPSNTKSNRELGEHIVRFVTCLTPPFRSNLHIYDVNSSISLQDTIHQALIQGQYCATSSMRV